MLDVSALPANARGEYRLGIKRGYDWMPKTLENRIKSKRKEKLEKIHRAQLNDITERLEALNRKGARSPTGEVTSDSSANLTADEKELKEELSAQVEQAGQLMSGYSDPGPIFDILAWISDDGEWRVVVDSRDDEEVAAGHTLQALRIFSKSGDFANFGEENMMNYSINVWNDGDVVEIVTNAGSHGTHVAGIVGAYHPPKNDKSKTSAQSEDDASGQDPENGVAPGCQIIGLKIGDSRLGSMETGVGLVRALIAARERKVDIVNISYGEPASMANSGRIAELVNELVDLGIMFIASASNSGPCLSTTGSPGGTAHGAIPVAAVYTPAMMAMQYSMRSDSKSDGAADAAARLSEQGPWPKPYNWSSRGPTIDGYYGPSISAPGGAIAPVPNWTLQKNQLMNGTSMSSPNACGCISLILSALKGVGAVYDAYSVRLAVENTALKWEKMHDPTALGHGLIQVASAYDFHMKHAEVLKKRVRYQALVQSRSNARGLYLRNENDFFAPELEEIIFVEPKFAEGATSEEKIQSDTKFKIQVSFPGVKAPEFFQVPHGGRSFKIQVTPPTLPTVSSADGTYWVGEIAGIDMAHPELGPLWRIPITIIRGVKVGSPTIVNNHVSNDGLSFSYNDLYCGPGLVYRKFYEVPQGVTYATIKLQTKDWPFARMALLSCQQVIPDQSHKHTLFDKYYNMKGNDERTLRVPLVGGLTFEVCVGQLWSAIGDEGRISFSVEFGGVTITDGSVNLTSFNEVAKIRVHNSCASNILQVKPVLCAVARTLYPAPGAAITPLSKDRDMLTKGRLIHQLTLTYTYTTEDAGIKVLVRSPFSTLLYESPFESQLILAYDANKVLISAIDFSPEWITLPQKGTYTFRLQMRHDDLSILEKLKTTSVQLERQLGGGKDGKTINLAVHETFASAIGGATKKLSAEGVRCTSKPQLPLYVVAPSSASQLPAFAKPGDVLLGAMSLIKFDSAVTKEKNFDDHGVLLVAPGVVPIKFVVPHKAAKPAPSDASSASSASPASSSASTTSSASSASSDAPKSDDKNAASSSAPAASAAVPKGALFITQSALSHLSSLVVASKFEEWEARSKEMLVVLPSLAKEPGFKNQTVMYYDWLVQQAGQKTEENLKKLATAADELIKQVDQTALAIYLGTRHPQETAEEKAANEKLKTHLVTGLSRKARTVPADQVPKLIEEISKWVDPATIPMLATLNAPSSDAPKNAQQLRALRKKIPAGEKPSKALNDEIISVLKALGWNHWAKYQEDWNVVRFSFDYGLF